MKKRLLAVLVAAVTAVSLLACGGGSSRQAEEIADK